MESKHTHGMGDTWLGACPTPIRNGFELGANGPEEVGNLGVARLLGLEVEFTKQTLGVLHCELNSNYHDTFSSTLS